MSYPSQRPSQLSESASESLKDAPDVCKALTADRSIIIITATTTTTIIIIIIIIIIISSLEAEGLGEALPAAVRRDGQVGDERHLRPT